MNLRRRALVVALVAIVGTAPAARAHLRDDVNVDVRRKNARRTARVIHDVFTHRKKAHQAQKVVGCESGFRVRVKSSNGEYWGLFQMGSGARDAYDWGWTRRKQTRAAHEYYLDAGWDPWAYCAP